MMKNRVPPLKIHCDSCWTITKTNGKGEVEHRCPECGSRGIQSSYEEYLVPLLIEKILEEADDDEDIPF